MCGGCINIYIRSKRKKKHGAGKNIVSSTLDTHNTMRYGLSGAGPSTVE